MINKLSSTPWEQIIHLSSWLFSVLTLSLMPSNIQSVMTNPTWHNAIPSWQLLSYFVISRDCTRTPKSRNYSSSPSDQPDNTQYRGGEESPDPKFVANWLTAILGAGRTAIIHFISSSQSQDLDWSGKITSRCLTTPGLFYSLSDNHRLLPEVWNGSHPPDSTFYYR